MSKKKITLNDIRSKLNAGRVNIYLPATSKFAVAEKPKEYILWGKDFENSEEGLPVYVLVGTKTTETIDKKDVMFWEHGTRGVEELGIDRNGIFYIRLK